MLTLYLSLLPLAIDLCDTHHELKVSTFHDLAVFAQMGAHATVQAYTHRANWQGHIWDVLLNSVSFYKCKY